MTPWSVAERLDSGEIARLQLRRLRALLEYLARTSPAYREEFAAHGVRPSDIKSLDDVRRLPLTTKADLEADTTLEAPPPFYRKFFVDHPQRVLRWHRTSGTTGIPVRVGDTVWDWHAYGDLSAEALWALGIRAHDTVVLPFGYGPYIAFWTYISGLEQIGATFVPSGSLDARTRIALLQQFGVTVVISTPSYGLHLGEVAKEVGVDLRATAVRLIITTGEPLDAERKKRLAHVWGAQVLDRIGTAEAGGIAYECPLAPGIYHVQENHVLAEVLDPAAGVPVERGGEGELVVTPLWRRGMPLIRFRTGNIVRLSERAACACGRSFLSLAATPAGVVIRRTDALVKVRGVLLDPIAVERVVQKVEDCGDTFQLTVERDGELDRLTLVAEVGVATTGERRAAIVRGLEDTLHQAIGLRVDVSLVPIGGLRLDGNKVKRLVDLRRRA